MPFDLVSFFCGAGGLDEGFRQAGFKTRLAIDINQASLNTVRHNHDTARVFRADVMTLTTRDVIKIIGHSNQPIGILGGPPCQSFSTSNTRQDPNDQRNLLPDRFAELICFIGKIKNIGFFVFENVPGIIGPKHIDKYNSFKARVRKGGFRIFETIMDAQDYGVPQSRKRVIAVGINTRMYPGRIWRCPNKLTKKKITVADAIQGLQEPVIFKNQLVPKEFPLHPNHWCMKPKSNKFQSGKLKGSHINGRSFRVLNWHKPSLTVAYGNREVHIHPDGHRRLSVFEAMLLQSFPSEYQLIGNLSEQFSLVSDAVPPLMARHIAHSLVKCLRI